MDALVFAIPLLPFLAALCIGIGHFSGFLTGVKSQAMTSRLAYSAINLSTLVALILLWAGYSDRLIGQAQAGMWLASDSLEVNLAFNTTGHGMLLSALYSLIFVVIFRFSRNYLHSESGYHRFFMLLCLFAGAMHLLLLSANSVGTFFGWELAGFCSFLLIAFAWHRDNASRNACSVFIVNRVGDAFFILGIVLCFSWLDTIDWEGINTGIATLSTGQANLVATSFIIAAMVKSVQFPFTWWINRSMEGPTPSSAVFYGAVMVHSGVFLLILMAPVLEQAPAAGYLLVIIGLLTFLYCTLCAQSQVDIKSSLGFATGGQLGLMFVECGAGLWQLALIHLCAHAVVRSYLYLSAPSILHNVHGNPVQPVTLNNRLLRWLSLASLHNFWLEEQTRQAITRPCMQLARELASMDDNIVDPLVGFPNAAVRSSASLAFREEQKIGARLEAGENSFSSGSGLAGKLTALIATLSGWFELQLVRKGVEKDLPEAGRRLGYIASSLEQGLLRPRYLVLFILVTVLFTF